MGRDIRRPLIEHWVISGPPQSLHVADGSKGNRVEKRDPSGTINGIVGDVVPRVKVLAAKPGDHRSVFRVHIVEGGK